MLKQYLRSSIIVIFQFTGVALLAAIIVPLILEKADWFSQLNQFLLHHKRLFCISHGIFYAALYVLWPRIVRLIAHHQHATPTAQQINQAIHTRCYLIVTFISVELLNLLR